MIVILHGNRTEGIDFCCLKKGQKTNKVENVPLLFLVEQLTVRQEKYPFIAYATIYHYPKTKNTYRGSRVGPLSRKRGL